MGLFTASCCAHYWAFVSAAGMIFLSIIGIIVASGTNYFKVEFSSDHKSSATLYIFITVAIYAVIFAVSIFFIYKKPKNYASNQQAELQEGNQMMQQDLD